MRTFIGKYPWYLLTNDWQFELQKAMHHAIHQNWENWASANYFTGNENIFLSLNNIVRYLCILRQVHWARSQVPFVGHVVHRHMASPYSILTMLAPLFGNGRFGIVSCANKLLKFTSFATLPTARSSSSLWHSILQNKNFVSGGLKSSCTTGNVTSVLRLLYAKLQLTTVII